MIYANMVGYVAAGLGGFILGMMFGARLKGDVTALIHSMESRLSGLESTVASHKATDATAQHAAAVEKLAGAIEKHAAAIDNHGAATVAAAVEASAAPKAHEAHAHS